MDEGDAVDHAPREPLSDQLNNYVRVNFENIDWDEWYYVTDEDDYDYIVYVTRHGDDPEPPEFIRVLRKYRRRRDDVDDEWDFIDEDEPNVLTKDDIHQGEYKFYTYNPQHGGGLAEDVRSALSDPVYTLPAGTDFSVAVLPAREKFQEQNVLVQEQAGIPALPLVVRHKSRKSRHRHRHRRRSRKIRKSRKRKTRRS